MTDHAPIYHSIDELAAKARVIDGRAVIYVEAEIRDLARMVLERAAWDERHPGEYMLSEREHAASLARLVHVQEAHEDGDDYYAVPLDQPQRVWNAVTGTTGQATEPDPAFTRGVRDA